MTAFFFDSLIYQRFRHSRTEPLIDHRAGLVVWIGFFCRMAQFLIQTVRIMLPDLRKDIFICTLVMEYYIHFPVPVIGIILLMVQEADQNKYRRHNKQKMLALPVDLW